MTGKTRMIEAYFKEANDLMRNKTFKWIVLTTVSFVENMFV